MSTRIIGHCPTPRLQSKNFRITRATTLGPAPHRHSYPTPRDALSPGALPGAAAVMVISEAKPGSCDGAALSVPRHEGSHPLGTAPPLRPSAPCGYGGRSDLGGNPRSEAPRTRMGRDRATQSNTPDKPTPYPRGNAEGGREGTIGSAPRLPSPFPPPSNTTKKGPRHPARAFSFSLASSPRAKNPPSWRCPPARPGTCRAARAVRGRRYRSPCTCGSRYPRESGGRR